MLFRSAHDGGGGGQVSGAPAVEHDVAHGVAPDHDDVFNAVMIRGNAVGDVMFYGRGAGDLPTASAVMSDVLDAAAHRQNRRDIGWNESAEVTPAGEIPMKWYLRGSFSSEDAKTLCGEVEVLSSGAVITGALTEAQVKDAAEKLGAAAMLRVL